MRKIEETRLINNDRAGLPSLVKITGIGFIRIEDIVLSE